jgi:protein-S-isoprenylcysteine O-methyltransferase Ste14
MSKCGVRLLLWLLLCAISIAAGISVDVLLRTPAFPVVVRVLGLAGMVLAYFPIQRSGKLLRLLGDSVRWGCTTRLVTTDIYQCVRHPHHMAVGVFMTSLGLFVGHWGSLLLIALTQWLWILGFLFLVEEKELEGNFGDEYRAYRREVPMLFPKLLCVARILSRPIEVSRVALGRQDDN